MTLAGTTYKMGPKGQVVIPKPIRDRLGLQPGDRLQVCADGDGVHIRKAGSDAMVRRAIATGLRGALAGGPSLTAALEAERRQERAREERGLRERDADRRP